MIPPTVASANREALIQRWKCQLVDRTHISFQELMHLLRQRVWINSQITFFSHIDFYLIFTKHDLFFFLFSAIVGDALLPVRSWFERVTLWSWMDWICIQSGRVCVHDIFIYFVSTNIWSYIYINRISDRTKEVRTLEPFIRAFRHISRGYDSLSINDFCILFEDSSV